MLPDSYLSLTRIFLHNWHRFHHDIIDVDDSLYLAGHNASGKSSVLDAMQVVLIADLVRIRFNVSAQDKSDRNLDTYVRGRIGENYWLRPGNTIAYVALEFADQRGDTAVTLGVCIEAGEGRSPERTHFILRERFDADLFVPDGRPLKRSELRKLLRQRRGAHSYDNVGEYLADMLNVLGGLNPRFGELFLKALRFEPIRNIGDFVEQWLLDKKEVHVETLQNVRENLQSLQLRAERVERQLEQLDDIVDRQRETLRLAGLRDQYTLLVALLRAEAVARRIGDLGARIEEKQRELVRLTGELGTARASLAGAEAAHRDAQRRYYESDIVRRRDELLRAIERDTREADSTRDRWTALCRDLRREADALSPALGTPALAPDEDAAVQSLVAAIRALSPDAPPSLDLGEQLDRVLLSLDAAAQRATEARVRLGDRVRDLKARGDEVQREIEELARQGRIRYRREVERLQELLTPIVGERPVPLCERIEVADPRWQDAVEAMLGPRRFNLIIPPARFDEAVHELDRVRARESLYDVGLIDLERAAAEARAARPNALAAQVLTDDSALRAYLDSVLGDIIACESVDELRRHRRAVTPEVVVYGEWTVRAVRPQSYTPHYIGQGARQSQIDARRHELDAIGRQLADLAPQLQAVETAHKLLNRQREWIALRERLNAPLDDRPLREQIARYQSELDALDLSGVAELEREVKRLESLMSELREQEKQLIRRESALQTEASNLRDSLHAAEAEKAERDLEADATRDQFPNAVIAGEKLLLERRAADLSDETRKAENRAKAFDTQANNVLQALTERASAYNKEFDFLGHPSDPRDERYDRERERLAATELPRFKAQIDEANRQAEHELREHVLHTLREHIDEAKREFRRINDALARLEFRDEKYAFRYEPNDEVAEFYRLVTADSQLLGTGPLFESQFYREHQATFDLFYDQLTRKPATEVEKREQDRLIDYRHYLKYDIEVTNIVTGQKSRLSKIMGQTSGGETQTPFYLTIAASFVQLYRVHERSGQPTIRLVVFDEAFSKMDQDRIGSTLDLFQQFQLQIVTATPLERCEYLVPKMCTNLVLTAVKDRVHIEPYRNYAARLYGNGTTAPDRA